MTARSSSSSSSSSSSCVLDEGVHALGRPATIDDLQLAAKCQLQANPHVVRDRLRYLSAHPARLEHVAAQSYWHANGFAKIRLIKGHDVTVRLHVWPAGDGRGGDVNPHGHRWEFVSWIAAGTGVRETYFAEVDPGSSPDRQAHADSYLRCDYGRVGDGVVVRPTGAALLRPTVVRHHSLGEVYGCSLETIHTVAPRGRDLVATVLLQGPSDPDAIASVYLRDRAVPTESEQVLSADELRELLQLVDRAIVTEVRTEPDGQGRPAEIFGVPPART